MSHNKGSPTHVEHHTELDPHNEHDPKQDCHHHRWHSNLPGRHCVVHSTVWREGREGRGEKGGEGRGGEGVNWLLFLLWKQLTAGSGVNDDPPLVLQGGGDVVVHT